MRFVRQMLQRTMRGINNDSQRRLTILVQADHHMGLELDWEHVQLPALIARMGIASWSGSNKDRCMSSQLPGLCRHPPLRTSDRTHWI